jgi:predicted ATPase/class 3 adenylate cyclase
MQVNNPRACARCGQLLSSSSQTCSRCGLPAASQSLYESSKELRHLTVLFCDLVGSTAMSQRLEPDEFAEVVRAYQHACAEIIEQRNGYIAQYLGDGILAYFGYPVAGEEDARRAVDAGLAIARAAGQIKAGEGTSESLEVRIGIHSGVALTGEIGGGAHREKLALGSVPNLAAKLQGVASPNAVIISDATHRLVDGFFVCEALGDEQLLPTPAFRVVASGTAISRFELAERRGLTPFRGRGQALRQLQVAWGEARAGRGSLVVVGGDAGIGKSRLVHELCKTLHTDDGDLLVARCSASRQDTPFLALATAFKERLRFDRERDEASKLDRLTEFVVSRGLDREALLSLAPLVSLAQPPDLTEVSNDAEQRRRRLLDVLAALLVRTDRPETATLWIIEDAHWLDLSTWELLRKMAPTIGSSRLLVVATYRPELDAGSLEIASLQRMVMAPLPAEDARGIVRDLAKKSGLDEELQQQIVMRADGVPLFLEELTMTLLEAARSSRARSERQTTPAIPPTLHDSLAARLDRLPSGRRVAQIGSVLGREFREELLRAMCEDEPGLLEAGLQELVRAGLLQLDANEGRASLVFKHALVQDVAYGSLVRQERVQYHAKAARAFTECFPTLSETQPELIAQHLFQAGNVPSAFDAWRRAADNALERAACGEALRHVNRCMDLLDRFDQPEQRRERELSLQMQRARALTTLHGYANPNSIAAYKRALELCEAIGDAQVESDRTMLLPATLKAAQGIWSAQGAEPSASTPIFWILWGFGAYYQVRGELREALRIGKQLLEAAGDDPALQLEGHFGAGSSLYFLGELDAALEHLTAGLACHAALTERSMTSPTGHHAEVMCAGYRQLVLWHLGRMDEAAAQREQTLEMARATEHPYSIAYAFVYGAWFELLRGDPAAARSYVEQADALSREHEFALLLGWSKLHWLSAQEGIWSDDDDKELRAALEASRAGGLLIGQSQFLGNLAESLLRRGRTGDALQAIDEAYQQMAMTQERFWEPELMRLQSECLLVQGDRSASVGLLERAIALAQIQKNVSFEERLVRTLRRVRENAVAPSTGSGMNGSAGEN